MKIKTVLGFFLIACFIFSCNLKPDHFTVSGIITDATGGKLFLERLTGTSSVVLDSVIIDATGKFKFAVKATDAGFYSLSLDHKRSITLAVVPGEKLEISATANDMNANYTVSGSRDSELTRMLVVDLRHTLTKIEALGKTYYDSLQSPHILAVKQQLDSMYKSIINAHRQNTIQFIHENPGSLAALMALYQQVPSSNPQQTQLLLDPMSNIGIYELVDSMMMKKYPTAEPVIILHKQMIGYHDSKKQFDQVNLAITPGRKAPEIILPSATGDTVKLSKLAGKYVLVNFWASWSDESRRENTMLKTLYAKYRWDGFEILQVSLDKSKDDWLKAIEEDKLPWKNGCDLKFWNSPVAATYNVRQLPVSMLVNKEGRIMQKEVTTEQLKKILQNLFKY